MSTLPIAALLDEIRRLRLLDAQQLKEASRGSAKLRDAKSLALDLVRRGWLSAFQAGQLMQGKGADLLLGSYLLLDKLGEGGMGQVYKAKHQGMNRLVALKVVRQELAADTEIVARFYREMELTSQLAHPNLVRAYDAGPLGGTHFLTMEYVEGIDLDRLVEQSGPLPVAQAVDYIRQAAVGLQCIHDHGLVHRDIKPSNLLRTPAGVVKILDLGLARLQEGAHGKEPTRLPDGTSITTVTLAGSVTLGTVDYLAPEQALDFHDVDIRADIYSLGCAFYHLLAGQPPFGEGTLAIKLMRHQQVEPPDVRQVRPEVTREVAAVLRRMMAKRPADRYRTPAQVAAALDGSKGASWSKRKWLTAAALAVLFVGVISLWSDVGLIPDGATGTAATQPMRNAQLRDLADNTWVKLGRFEGNQRGAWEVPWCYDPDLRRLVRVGGRTPDHSNEIWSFDVGAMKWTQNLPFAIDPSGANRGLGNRPSYGSNRGSVYDRDRRCVWAYGAGYAKTGSKGGLWQGMGDLQVENWTHMEALPHLSGGQVAYDEHAGKLVCLGKDMGSFGRTHVYDPDTGKVVAAAADPTGALAGRVGMGEGAGFLFVPELSGCLLVGLMANQSRVITWQFDCATGKWRDLAPTGSVPVGRRGLGMSYDRQNRVVVVFGGLYGRVGSNPLADTWVYDPARNAWKDMKPSGGPQAGGGPNKDCQMLAYDEEHNVHVLGLVDHGEDSGVWVYRYRR